MELIDPGAVILVTGASGSIGFEIAAQAAEAGAVVGVHGSRPESATAAVGRLTTRAPGAKMIAVSGDFRVPGVIDEVVHKIADAGGRLDAMIHCATAGSLDGSRRSPAGSFRDTDPQTYIDVCLGSLGVFQQLCFAALPHLVRQGGTIVGFASDAGRFAAPRQAIMGGVYGGIMSFVRNLAVETAREGVRVHCISPSFVAETRIFEHFQGAGGRAESARNRAGLGLPTPRDIAPMALFLCGPSAARMTGQIISINGGLHA